MFLMDMHIYQIIVIVGALLSLNFLMKVARDKDAAQKYITDTQEAVKDAVSKKKDWPRIFLNNSP